jgi:alpha-ketoglutarate-dependent taurine dioxygenase
MSQEQLIKTDDLRPGQRLPLVIQPNMRNVNLTEWAKNNLAFIETKLLQHGAILFRDFNMHTVAQFEQFQETVSGELMEYRERSSPRSQVSERVYTSTDYPANQSIFPHNEHSYARTLPLKISFFCVTAAQQGGETPIGDCRRVLQRLNPKTRERFIQKKWMYVRNFGDGFGLHWPMVFQTTDRTVVEQYCHENDIQWEWKDGNRLRTRQVRPAVARHPRTGEMVWFNHATFFHVSTLEPTIRETLLAEFKEEDLPNNTYYGDGSPIESAVLDELREAYQQEMVPIAWQERDILMLDNMLTAHAREPFVGPRKVLVAMADLFTRDDL